MAASIASKVAVCSNFTIVNTLLGRTAVKYLNTIARVTFAHKKYVSEFESDKKRYKKNYYAENEDVGKTNTSPKIEIRPSIPAEHQFIDEDGNVMDATRSEEFGLLIPDEEVAFERKSSTIRPSVPVENELVNENVSKFNTSRSFGRDKMEEDFESEFVPESKTDLLRTNYPELIKKLLAEGKYQEAVDVVTVTMIKEEKIKPSAFAYNLLLGAFGRLGNVEVAFKLYRQMTDRALKPDAATYTSLFNACANSSDKQEGLRRATNLREKIKSKGEIMNSTNYHAVIKAFGLCGDLWSAFEIADEMLDEGHNFSSDTLNFLLMACASDHQTGYKKALTLWHMCQQRKLQPSIFSYNLLLRITRDCGVGSESHGTIGPGDGASFLPRGSVSKEKSLSTKTINNELVESTMETAQARLKVLGDVDGFLNHMKNNEIKPDLKTFALLLEIAESNTQIEDSILSFMTKHKVKPDAAIFNVLIKKRVYRNDELGVENAFSRMNEMGIYPDIMTFGTLAIACKTRKKCIEFLQSLHSAGFRPNIQIIGALVQNMSYKQDWYYLSRLLQLMLDENIQAEKRILQTIGVSIDRFKKRITDEERGKPQGQPLTEHRKEDYRRFLSYYKKWMSNIKMSSQSILSQVTLKKDNKNVD